MIDFTKIKFRDGTSARLMRRDGWQEKTGDTRHRVMRVTDSDKPTIVLCDDKGRCNPDRESPWDVVAA